MDTDSPWEVFDYADAEQAPEAAMEAEAGAVSAGSKRAAPAPPQDGGDEPRAESGPGDGLRPGGRGASESRKGLLGAPWGLLCSLKPEIAQSLGTLKVAIWANLLGCLKCPS